jgi:hypothetical protein
MFIWSNFSLQFTANFTCGSIYKHKFDNLIIPSNMFDGAIKYWRVRVMVFNTTFNNISVKYRGIVEGWLDKFVHG